MISGGYFAFGSALEGKISSIFGFWCFCERGGGQRTQRGIKGGMAYPLSTHESRVKAMEQAMARAGVPKWLTVAAVACAEEHRMLSDAQKRRLRRERAVPAQKGIRERMRLEANADFLRRHPEYAPAEVGLASPAPPGR